MVDGEAEFANGLRLPLRPAPDTKDHGRSIVRGARGGSVKGPGVVMGGKGRAGALHAEGGDRFWAHERAKEEWRWWRGAGQAYLAPAPGPQILFH